LNGDTSFSQKVPGSSDAINSRVPAYGEGRANDFSVGVGEISGLEAVSGIFVAGVLLQPASRANKITIINLLYIDISYVCCS
jgi:hypothetical protein